MDKLWDDMANLVADTDAGTTLELKWVQGEGFVARIAETESIMWEWPAKDASIDELVNVPEWVTVLGEYHDSETFGAFRAEALFANWADEVKEFGGRVLFEVQPIQYLPDDESGEPVLEGWCVLAQDRVGDAGF